MNCSLKMKPDTQLQQDELPKIKAGHKAAVRRATPKQSSKMSNPKAKQNKAVRRATPKQSKTKQ